MPSCALRWYGLRTASCIPRAASEKRQPARRACGRQAGRPAARVMSARVFPVGNALRPLHTACRFAGKKRFSAHFRSCGVVWPSCARPFSQAKRSTCRGADRPALCDSSTGRPLGDPGRACRLGGKVASCSGHAVPACPDGLRRGVCWGVCDRGACWAACGRGGCDRDGGDWAASVWSAGGCWAGCAGYAVCWTDSSTVRPRPHRAPAAWG